MFLLILCVPYMNYIIFKCTRSYHKLLRAGVESSNQLLKKVKKFSTGYLRHKKVF